MTSINFLFDIGQIVKTPLGDKGLVQMAAVDEGGILKYYVICSNGASWFVEHHLKAA